MRAGVLLALSASAQQIAPSVAQQHAASVTPQSAQASPMPAVRVGYRFPDHQTWTYDVEWRVFNAGTATLRMDAADGQQRVIGTADSIGAIALLYHVHDRFESFIDPKTYCSLTIAKQTEEGLRRVNTNIRFDYADHKSVLDEKNLKKNQSKREEHDIPSCVTDVLSAIYYVGALPLASDASYRFPLNDGGKTANVTVNVEAKEQVTVPAGTFHAIRVQPQSDVGTLKDKGKIWVWYSDDDRRIPVQVRARMFWGTLTLRLSRIEAK